MNKLEAHDLMFALVKTTLEANSLEDISWPNVEFTIPSDNWARVSTVSGGDDQNSLSDRIGQRIWNNTGTLYVECFSPIGSSAIAPEEFCEYLVGAFRSANHGSLFYRRPKSVESKPDGGFLKQVFMVDYEYDSIA